MSVFVIKLTHNAAEVSSRLGAFPPALLQGVARAMDNQNALTITQAQVDHLRGPRPQKLGRVTSDLANSLNAPPAQIDGQRVTSSIGSNLVYAAPHEYGFQGVVRVPAHSRRIVKTSEKATARLDARGRIRRSRKIVKTQTGTAQVREHKRTLILPERAYIRTSITEREQNYTDAISAAIVAAWEGGAS